MKYTVTHDGGTTQVTVNQELNGGIWMLLGLYDLTPGSSPKVEITDQSSQSGQNITPDAVRAVRHTTAETELIVDNGDAGTSETGTWSDGTNYASPRGMFCGAKARDTLGGTSATYTWPLGIAAAGKYQLYARWTAKARFNQIKLAALYRAGSARSVRDACP